MVTRDDKPMPIGLKQFLNRGYLQAVFLRCALVPALQYFQLNCISNLLTSLVFD